MSVRNLIPYLKSKQNEIVDCNIQNEELYFMRLYNVPTNTFFILDVHEQNIPVNSSVLELFPVSRLRKLNEFEEDYTEDLILFFQSIETHFPSSMKHLIFFHGDYIIQNRSNIFKMDGQFISSSHHHPYSYFTLEWFYDNHAKLESIVRPFQNDFFLKVHQLLNSFLNTFSNQNMYYDLLRNHYNSIEEKRKIYETVVKLSVELQDHFQDLLKELKKQDDFSKVFSVAESESRIFRKKKIREQLSNLNPLRKKTRDTLLSYRNELFFHELVFIRFIHQIQSHLSKLQSVQFEYETLIQR